MKYYLGSSFGSASPIVFTIILLVTALGTGLLLTHMNLFKGFGIVVFLLFFVGSFLWPELGLYIVYFAMLLSPQIGAGSVSGSGTLGRGITLRLEDFLLICISFAWIARLALMKEAGFFRNTLLNWPIAAYILVTFVATLWGAAAGTVKGAAGFFFVLKYFEYVVLFFMVINYFDTPQQAKRLLLCLLVTCFLVCLYGLTQIPGGGRVSAPFEGEFGGEPNTYGGYLVLIGAVVGALLEEVRGYWSKVGLILLLALIAINLVYTQSRSSYLAVIPAYLVLACFSRWKVPLIVGLLGALALSPFILPETVKQRLAFTFNQPRESGQLQVGKLKLDTSTSERLKSWQHGFNGWLKKPLLGYGTTGFTFMDAQYPRILVETGILGIMAFLWLIYCLFRLGITTWLSHEDPFTRALSAGFTAGLVGMLVHAIGANTFIIVRIMEPFWGLAAIVLILSEAETDNTVGARAG